MRSTPFMTGALIVGVASAASLGLMAGSAVPTNMKGVDTNRPGSRGWTDDVADNARTQETQSYTVTDSAGPPWLFNATSLPPRFADDETAYAYDDTALQPDQYDYTGASSYQPDDVINADYDTTSPAMDDAPEAAAQLADQAAREVQEAEKSPATTEPSPSPTADAGQTAQLAAAQP